MSGTDRSPGDRGIEAGSRSQAMDASPDASFQYGSGGTDFLLTSDWDGNGTSSRKMVRILAIGLIGGVLAAGCSANGSASTIVTQPASTVTTTTEAAQRLAGPPPAGLFDLVESHNDIGLDRINLIFVPRGWEYADAFVDLAETLLSFDTEPIAIDDSGIQFAEYTGQSRNP